MHNGQRACPSLNRVCDYRVRARSPSLILAKILRFAEEKRRCERNSRGRSQFLQAENPESLMYISFAGDDTKIRARDSAPASAGAEHCLLRLPSVYSLISGPSPGGRRETARWRCVARQLFDHVEREAVHEPRVILAAFCFLRSGMRQRSHCTQPAPNFLLGNFQIVSRLQVEPVLRRLPEGAA